MGWSFGHNGEGREVGYSVEATCDKEGCEARIDRGVENACGGMHDGGEHGCGRYFCEEHRTYGGPIGVPGQLCEECSAMWVDCEACGGWGNDDFKSSFSTKGKPCKACSGLGSLLLEEVGESGATVAPAT